MFLLLLFISSSFASSPITPPIVGGVDASLKDFPWQVSLQYSQIEGFHFCGGAIIDATHILTAAHCVDDPSHPFEVLGGGDGSRTQLQDLPRINKVILHPDYVTEGANGHAQDIAVLEMASPIVFSNSIQPINLPQKEDELESLKSGKNLAITGFGYDRSMKTTSHLKVVHGLEFIPEQKLGDLFFAFKVVNHQTSCMGDSGGPLVDMSTKTLIGLSSHGSSPDCYIRNEFNYTNLYRYLDWIRSLL